MFLLFLVVFFGIFHLILRYWLLPDIENYKNSIATAITQAAGQRVTIGSISATWDGLHPHLILRKVYVHDKEDKPALILNRLETIPSWDSFLSGELRFLKIKIDKPDLTVYRDSKGLLHVAGIALIRDPVISHSSFLDWLLSQKQVDVVNANISWKDEKRGAPLLELESVSLYLENYNVNRHRFSLHAIPPAKIASPIDIRGDFVGKQLNILEQWDGNLLVKLDYADIAAWQSWFPVIENTEINRGVGAIRIWLNFDDRGIKHLTSDILLKNVKTRFAHELPELDLLFLRGRIGWKRINSEIGNGFELYANQLEASIRGESILVPVDFIMQDIMTHDKGRKIGKLSIKKLDLETWGKTVRYIPIEKSIRNQFNKLLPYGDIYSIQAKWDGLWSDPVNLNVKGKFNNIGIHNSMSSPEIKGISGNIKIQVANRFGSDTNVLIKGAASGLTKKFIKLSAENIIDTFTPDEIDRFDITGNGELLIDLSIPLPYSGGIKVSGSYFFKNNTVDLGSNIPNLEKINGILNFTESTIEIEEITAQILGGMVTINSTVSENNGVNLIASGEIDLDNMHLFNQEEDNFWNKYVSGSAAWNGSIKIENNAKKIRPIILIESSLEGVSLDFPWPFSKKENDSTIFRLVNIMSDLNHSNFKINYGQEVAAEINLSPDKSGDYYVENGLINLGSDSSQLPASGMLLAGTISKFQLDKWNNLLDEFNSSKEISNKNRVDFGLSKIDVSIGELDLFGKRFNDLSLIAIFDNGEWEFDILSKEVSGKINWDLRSKEKIIGKFKRLAVPSSYHIYSPVSREKNSVKDFPAIDISSDKFFVNGNDLGKLGITAQQTKKGWVIDELHITTPDSLFTADGIWRNYSIAPRMDMNINLSASDLNKLLTRLGYSDRIKRGKGEIFGNLSWLGGPQKINYKTLSGKINLEMKDGQFPKFELGIGKLFGIFDLGALPRRVILDFRDVYADGFGFDKVSGSAEIIDGIMSTERIKIKGPAATVKVDGEIDLFSETYALHFLVNPSLGLAAPVVDIATLIVNKAKKGSIKPHEYNITGPWKDPIVKRLH
tara:strand:- start:36210 stop:39398 length:3189 start_codon:yes stop_codon:yes gene_type:complete